MKHFRPPRYLIGLPLLLGLLLAAQVAGSGPAGAAAAAVGPNGEVRTQDFFIHLGSPGDGASMAWTQGGDVVFTWGTNFYCTGSGCPIKLAIGTDPNVGQTVYDQQVGQPCTISFCPSTETVKTLLPGKYYWHVYATYCCGQVFSEIWSLTLTGTLPPVIKSFSPNSGVVGTTVTITGTGFTGATAVKFNGTAATFNGAGDTSITTTVPTGAASGPISVTNPGGTGTSASPFTVTAPPTPPPPPPPASHPKLGHWSVTKGGPKAGANFSVYLDVVDSKSGETSTGGKVACSARLGSTLLLVPVSKKFVSSLDEYVCTWRLPSSSAGLKLSATASVTFKDAGVTVSNPVYRAVIGAVASAQLVLIGQPAYSYPVSGGSFQASQSARLQFPNGSQRAIDWKAKGTSASCGGGVGAGKVELFSTGIRCTWAIPQAAQGKTITFQMTIHALGQVKTAQFSARVR